MTGFIDPASRQLGAEQPGLASAYHRGLIEASLHPLVTIDPTGAIADVNAATERITGCSRQELIGTEFAVYFTDPAAARDGYQQAFKEGSVHDHSLDLRHRDGRVTPVQLNASVFRDGAGNIVGVFAAARDMTERRSLEAQLRHSQKLEAVGRLAGGIAHDFNNVLMAIIGHASLLESRLQSDDPAVDDVRQILSAANRASRLTRSLLSFSRKQHLDVKPVDLDEVVRGVQDLLRKLITEAIVLELDLAGTGLTVLADAGQLEQVLMNLTTNAGDAMPNGGTIKIRTELVERGAEPSPAMERGQPEIFAALHFSDTGQGMTESTRNQIFEPFYTTKATGKGTGLGLAVCYGIIEQHHGHIDCASEPGRGATFTVLLPRVIQLAELPLPPLQRARRMGHETVLVAEDDDAVRKLTILVLESAGYSVVTASNGAEAVAKFREHSREIALCLFDVAMPLAGGIKSFETIRAIRPAVRVLFMSGYPAGADGPEDRPATGLDIVQKPFTPLELLARVREALDR